MKGKKQHDIVDRAITKRGDIYTIAIPPEIAKELGDKVEMVYSYNQYKTI